jgi:hypothetical protein
LPDLAPADVTVGAKTVFWGYNFQVSTTIQNLGQADSGPLKVLFLMTGSDGSLKNAIYLGQMTLPGLQKGTTQAITQTVLLPGKLPSGVSIASVGTGRVAVLVDPDHTLDETLRSNDLAESAPITLKVLGTDGTSKVPTSPAVGTTLGQPQPAGTIHTTITSAGATTTTTPAPAATTAKTPHAKLKTTGKLHRRLPPPKKSLTSKIEHQLKVFPDNLKNFFNDVIGNNTKSKTKAKAKKTKG